MTDTARKGVVFETSISVTFDILYAINQMRVLVYSAFMLLNTGNVAFHTLQATPHSFHDNLNFLQCLRYH